MSIEPVTPTELTEQLSMISDDDLKAAAILIFRNMEFDYEAEDPFEVLFGHLKQRAEGWGVTGPAALYLPLIWAVEGDQTLETLRMERESALVLIDGLIERFELGDVYQRAGVDVE